MQITGELASTHITENKNNKEHDDTNNVTKNKRYVALSVMAPGGFRCACILVISGSLGPLGLLKTDPVQTQICTDWGKVNNMTKQVSWNFMHDQLMRSGDVETNPGPKNVGCIDIITQNCRGLNDSAKLGLLLKKM